MMIFFLPLSDTLRELCPLGTLYWKYFPSAWPLYLTGKSIETCLMWVTASARPHDGVTSPTYHTYLLYACHEASQMGGKQTDGNRGRQKTKSGLSRNFYFSGEKLWQTEILFILISSEGYMAVRYPGPDLLECGDSVCDEGNQANHWIETKMKLTKTLDTRWR